MPSNGASAGLLDFDQTAAGVLIKGEVLELSSLSWKDDRVDLVERARPRRRLQGEPIERRTQRLVVGEGVRLEKRAAGLEGLMSATGPLADLLTRAEALYRDYRLGAVRDWKARTGGLAVGCNAGLRAARAAARPGGAAGRVDERKGRPRDHQGRRLLPVLHLPPHY